MVREIELTQGKVALVDDEDYEMLMRWKWQAKHHHDDVWYARHNTYEAGKKRASLIMHRVILGVTDPKVQVDHINHDGLDNRRSNIRICANGENPRNVRKTKSRTSSRYKGITWSKSQNAWTARVQVNGERFFLGYFASEDDAGEAYNRAAEEKHKEFAELNTIARSS